ncbi:ABC-2 transporter permease [Solibacillus sp. MA9]|uniref:ABC-2 transporter permease n=1 Tax=Solibacillus palustris TaxID=2908203 RepID=A0ABS9UB02_9BACL|nr:ABC-2 transporter permease [Solibacillus sp. MA9]MCH7321528.1 ABC-2 transporter permease [Solibacillus sp. MA9]
MLQLIKKDFYIQKMVWLFMILAIAIYIFAQASSLFVGIIFGIVMTVNLFAIDEKKSAQLLLNSLPFTRKEIVSSKYIAAFLYIMCIIATISVLHVVVNQAIPNIYHLLMICIVSLLVVAIFYPFAYRFSSKYFTFLFVGIFAAYLFCLKLFVPNINDQIRELVGYLSSVSQPMIYAYILVATVIFYSMSWLLSIRIYSKKVFE